MKLLIITNLFPTPGDSTRGVFNANQFRALPAQIEVCVLVPVPFPEWQRSYAGVREWQHCRVRYVPFFYLPGVARGWHGDALYLSLQASARQWIRAVAPDLILGSFLYPDGYAAAKLAERLGVPLVLKAHGSDVNQKARAPRLRERIQYALRRAAALVVVSETLQHELDELGYACRSVRVIQNGVDTLAFAPRDRAESRARLGLPLADKLVLFAGNLKVDKGAVDAVAAVCRLAESGLPCRLVIVGEGAAADEMRQTAQRRGASELLLWQGRRPHAQLAAYMNAADLLLLPSHAEGVPNVVLEAMACGTPVVATDVGGIPDLLPEVAGVLVPVGDVAAIAQGIGAALTRHFDSAAICRLVAQRSWSGSAAQLAAVLREVMANANAGPGR